MHCKKIQFIGGKASGTQLFLIRLSLNTAKIKESEALTA
jgi:hypothetical protein